MALNYMYMYTKIPMCRITIGVVCKHASVSSITSELKDKLSEMKISWFNILVQ